MWKRKSASAAAVTTRSEKREDAFLAHGGVLSSPSSSDSSLESSESFESSSSESSSPPESSESSSGSSPESSESSLSAKGFLPAVTNWRAGSGRSTRIWDSSG
ncbi:hypothetical protein FNV58_01335 (plasmid) [Streptomyces sp. RLB1-9]|nr:hypothetical protein FNV58_01335 [Streptomyces sp. RLB1-9]